MPSKELIVTFHGIGTPPDTVPAAERPYWVAPERFADLVPAVLGAAAARGLRPVFTFDDGNRSDLTIAAPVLKAQGACGIFFPCSGRIGQAGYLDAQDIRDLQAEGFEVGSHGIAHVPWGQLAGAGLVAEVGQSKADLETVLGGPVRAAALPFGSYRRRTLVALRRAGYRAVYSSDPGLSASESWFFHRFSYRVDRPFSPEHLADEALRWRNRLTAAVKGGLKALR